MKKLILPSKIAFQLFAITTMFSFPCIKAKEMQLINPFSTYGGDLRVTLFGYEYIKSLKEENKFGVFHFDSQFYFNQNNDLNEQIIDFVENIGGGYKTRATIIFVTERNVFVLPYANIKYLKGEFKPVDEFVSGDVIIFTSDQ